MAYFLSAALFFSGVEASSAELEKWYLKSNSDSYVLEKKDDEAFIGGKKINQKTFDWFYNVFWRPTDQNCPSLLTKPDLQVKVETDKGIFNKEFFVAEKTIREGKQCGSFDEPERFSIPLHRSWFVGATNFSIQISSVIEYQRPDFRVTFKRVGDDWESTRPDFINDLDFTKKWIDSLKDIEITERLHLNAALGAPSFTLTIDKRKYVFAKFDDNWGVQLPGEAWYTTSSAWEFWGDMDKIKLQAEHGGELGVIRDKKANSKTRIEEIKKLGHAWDSNIRKIYFSILQDSTDNADVRKMVAEIFIEKPTKENMVVVMGVLVRGDNYGLQSYLSQRLRILNKKGPQIDEVEPSLTERKKKVELWKEWFENYKE